MGYLNAGFQLIKKHWLTLFALLVVVWNYAKPTITAYIGVHPKASFWYGLAAVVVAFYLKSPSQKGNNGTL
jgi:hypothetical protein